MDKSRAETEDGLGDVRARLAEFRGMRWVIALSGGADSRALLELAAENRDLSAGLAAVYVHHHLRPEADAWEEFCRRECAALGVGFGVEHVTVRGDGSPEAAAREARYAALARHVPDGRHVLFTAHHADDLLETMLMALVRGAGLAGLAAIPARQPFAGGLLARPLLGADRAGIERFCARRGLAYVTDPSNADAAFDRNYIRRDVVPSLRKRFPAAAAAARRTAENLADDLRVLEDAVGAAAAKRLARVPYAGIALDLRGLGDDGPLPRALVRHFLKKYHGVVLSRARLGEVMKFVRAGRTGRAKLAAGDMAVSVFRGFLVAVPDTAPLRERGAIALKPGETAEIGGFAVTLRETAPGDPVPGPAAGYFVPAGSGLRIDFAPAPSLKLRPAGRGHGRTLKQLWKEYGVNLAARGRHPLVRRADGTVLALHGVFAAADAPGPEPGGAGRLCVLGITCARDRRPGA